MAVQVGLEIIYLTRSAAYLDITADWTVTFWARQTATAPSGGDFRVLWMYGDITAATDPYIYLGSSVNGSDLFLETFDGAITQDSAAFTPTANTFFSGAIVYTSSTTSLAFRVNGALIGSLTIDLSGVTFVDTDEGFLGQPLPGTFGNDGGAYHRVRQVAMTPTQIAADAASPTPVLLTGLLTNTPLGGPSDLTDTVAGRNWTATGTPTYLTGPLPPANTTPATATVISSLNHSETLYVQDAPTGTGYSPSCTSLQNHAVWWKYTAVAGDVVLSVVADATTGSSYLANVDVWIGTPPSLTEFAPYVAGSPDPLCDITEGGFAMNVPVTVGTTYYFQVTDKHSTEPLAADLAFSVVRPTVVAQPAGSLLVLNDGAGWPAWALSAIDGTLLRPLTLPASEQAAFLPTGEMATWVENGATSDVTSLAFYTSSFALQATVTSLIIADQSPVGPITTNGVDTFYLAVRDAGNTLAAVVYTATAAGVLFGTPWTLPANSKGMSGMAVSPAENILYYVTETSGDAVHAYDLVARAALPDFLAGVVGTKHGRDVLTLSTGDVLVINLPGTTGNVTRYNAAGVLQQTYPSIPNTKSAPRLALSNDQASLIVMAFPAPILGVSYSRFMTFDMATASVTSFDVPFLEPGAALENIPFGPSQSCPLLVLPLGITPPTPPVETAFTDVVIRRMRRTPHLNKDHKRVTFTRFEILAQVGEGLLEGQGVDPQICLRWSDDGGRTWSREHWTTLGKLGEYRTRVLWRRLGQARDRVFEVVVTDPVQASLITAYVDAQAGSS